MISSFDSCGTVYWWPFFLYLQLVCDLIPYLQHDVLMPSPPSNTCSECVIPSDICGTARWSCLTGSTWSHPIRAEQHVQAIFAFAWSRPIPAARHADILVSFAYLKLVRDLVRYLQNGVLTPSSPSPAYTWYVISSDTCRTACRHPLLLLAYRESVILFWNIHTHISHLSS